MPATDPAECRRILRGALECAIRLTPGTPPRLAAPLTAAVWRVIEPQLARRDTQIAAVRDILADMDGTPAAHAWAQQLHQVLDTRRLPRATRATINQQEGGTP